MDYSYNLINIYRNIFISYVLSHFYLATDLNLSMYFKSTLKIVIESNFKVYAFGPFVNNPHNTLYIKIMENFMDIRVKLPNMVSFIITRQKIVKALRLGITAKQILEFLEEYSVNDERMREADAQLEKANPSIRMNGRLDDSNFRNEKGMYYKV